MPSNNTINYIEFAARDLAATRAFFETVFGWRFTDYGPDYVAFSDAGVDGGFYRADLAAASTSGSALVVLYTDALEAVEQKVLAAGGKITKPVFAFPGGRRFQFTEPSGNELAVWTDVGI